MAFSATRVTTNFTSYTVSTKGVYVYTLSDDANASATTGGTAERLFYNSEYAGTVAVWWAEAGQTITVSKRDYGQLVRIDGFSKKPNAIKLASGSTSTTTSVANEVYIGLIVGSSHSSPGSLSYSFSCSGASITTLAHPSSDWSKNATSLIIPSTSGQTITAQMNSNSYKDAFILQLTYYKVDVEINPTGSGTITGDGNYSSGETATLTATPNTGYGFVDWQLKGYTRLEYIESTGTQYIDTEVLYSNDLIEVEVGLSSTDTPSGTYKTLLGMYTSSSNGTPFSIWTNSGFGQNFRDDVAGVNYPYAFDGTSQTFTFTNNSRTGSAYNIYLFKANAKGGNVYDGLSELKISSAKIKVNSNVVRNYVPVIRHSDGAIGLLDLVELKFYGNSGTGNFIGGGVYAS